MTLRQASTIAKRLRPRSFASVAVANPPTAPRRPLSREEDEDKRALAQKLATPQVDVAFLVNNYTAPALAAAYQDRCVLSLLVICRKSVVMLTFVYDHD